jgi:uncharacterized protein
LDTILIVPGLGDSGDSHWQTWIEGRLPNPRRVMQRDWETPDLLAWSRAVNDMASAAKGPVWMIAHSFGCLAAVHAAVRANAEIAGLLLVAPADPAKFGVTFTLPKITLPFPAILVGSENDRWMSLDAARRWSRYWGAAFFNAGRVGHINVQSGHGAWPEGLRLFAALQGTPATRRDEGLSQEWQ